MYPFAHSVTPAVRSHLDAQLSFFNDLNKSMTRSFQNLFELQIQLGQTMLEEGNLASHQMLTSDSPGEALTLAAARAQPAADKLRAYQQHIARVLADTQIALAQVTEQHSPLTSRTARNLADQVAKVAADETEKHSAKQQEMMNNFRDPFQTNGAAPGNSSTAAYGSMQSAEAQPAQPAPGKGSARSN